MSFRSPARKGRLFVFGLALWGFFAPSQLANAEPVNLLINGSFEAGNGGWVGVNGGINCQGAEPSMGPWGTNGLVFTYEYNVVYQEITIPTPSEVTLTFTGQLGEAGGYYEAILADGDESVATEELVNPDPENTTLSVTTEEDNEVVAVTFGGVDENWWSGCYGPIITDASLVAEVSSPPTTTTLPPEEYRPPSSGLDYWSFDSSGGQPQLPPSGQQLSEGHADGLDYDWGGGQVLDSGKHDGVIVQFEGWLSPPEPKTYYICAFTDDGFKLYLDDDLAIDDWWDRGPTCGNTADVDFSDGQAKHLQAYFYENGGGAVARLLYYTDSGSWQTIPNSWYSDGGTLEPPTTTTTTLPMFLGSPTDVSVSQGEDGILIDWEASSEDVGISPERYAITWEMNGSGWGISTGNPGDPNALETQMLLDIQLFESTGGLDAEYLFTVRSDNDSQGVYSQVSDAFLFVVASPVPETTTTTTEAPQTTTTTSPPITTAPPTTINDNNDGGGQDDSTDEPEEPPVDGTTPPPTPEDEVPESTPGGENEETTPETPVEPQPENTNSPIDDEVDAPTDEPVVDDPVDEQPAEETPPLGEELISEEAIEGMTGEEISEVVDQIIEDGLTEDTALLLATSTKVLSSLDSDQAKEVFSTLDVGELTDDEIAEVVSAVQDAPEEVRSAFEEEINIFGSGGAMDEYVPLGSVISVGERRVVIAATGIILAGVPMPSRGPSPAPTAPSSAPSSSSSSSQSDSSRKRGR